MVRREVLESIAQINHTLDVSPGELASIHRADESFGAELYVPFGIVAAIVPGTHRFHWLPLRFPALLAGNAVIKLSPRAPHGVTKFLDLLRNCLPGLISVLHG